MAVMLDRKQEVQMEPEIPFSINFKDCTFTGNQVVILDEGVTIDRRSSCDHKGGTLYIEAAGSTMVDFNATGVDIHDYFFGYQDEQRDFQTRKYLYFLKGMKQSL
ncbi:hypothetical protein AWC38_SpisGene799 [Stylophora pistillata]|uniref:Uncharacterized protein n=1 Tax=Stylophora pistillata TaxID=50429 RepID=A0A2B4SUG1_STYPI|nr:hypothetical protein AWC38_SpisGene799 [Stylophora pistillata]